MSAHLSIQPYTCRCGSVVNGVTILPGVTIGPGFNIICGRCLFVSVFDDSMQLRAATQADLQISFARPCFTEHMIRLQRGKGWRVTG